MGQNGETESHEGHEGYITAFTEFFNGDPDRSEDQTGKALKRLAAAMVSHRPHKCDECLDPQKRFIGI